MERNVYIVKNKVDDLKKMSSLHIGKWQTPRASV
jgi:hypothetical protein